MDYTLTIVEGIQPGSNGVDLGAPDSPIEYGKLPTDVQTCCFPQMRRLRCGR